MSIMDSNHNIECGICGYRFKTLSKIEEHYHDYDLCEELVYYPDPKDSNPPHLVKNWICDKCFRRIGDAVKDNMIKDSNDFNIEEYFDKGIEFIQNAKANKEKGKLLVHCQQGKSRSSAILISYLIKEEQYTTDEAYKYLKKKRRMIMPNLGFMFKLREFERKTLT